MGKKETHYLLYFLLLRNVFVGIMAVKNEIYLIFLFTKFKINLIFSIKNNIGKSHQNFSNTSVFQQHNKINFLFISNKILIINIILGFIIKKIKRTLIKL